MSLKCIKEKTSSKFLWLLWIAISSCPLFWFLVLNMSKNLCSWFMTTVLSLWVVFSRSTFFRNLKGFCTNFSLNALIVFSQISKGYLRPDCRGIMSLERDANYLGDKGSNHHALGIIQLHRNLRYKYVSVCLIVCFPSASPFKKKYKTHDLYAS